MHHSLNPPETPAEGTPSNKKHSTKKSKHHKSIREKPDSGEVFSTPEKVADVNNNAALKVKLQGKVIRIEMGFGLVFLVQILFFGLLKLLLVLVVYVFFYFCFFFIYIKKKM